MLLGVLSLVLTTSAVGQSPPTSSGYDNTWYVSEFWSGEYPAGFSVTRKDTDVRARARMDKAAPREVACKLPYLAVIHPWNRSRIMKSKIRFFSATKILRLVAKEPFVYEFAIRHAPAIKIRLRKGDMIEYVRNDAEGLFEVRLAGKQYTADQNLFDHMEKVARDQFVEDDWVSLTCEGGSGAYILLSDLVIEGAAGERTPGVSEVGPGQADYGRARDLTAEEARELENAGGR
jgi:hypothetical protein